VSNEAEVLVANAAFYRAFEDRDVEAMERLWCERNTITCIHPGWAPLFGREAVMASFRSILLNPRAQGVRSSGAAANIVGDTAIVICFESVGGARLVATNVFVRDGAHWKMIHHQAGPVAEEEPHDTPPSRGDLN